MKYVDEIIALGDYEGELRRAIHRLKFLRDPEPARKLARELAGHLPKADALIPVPVDRETALRRGYNQARVIADVLSAETGVPVLPVLKKCKKSIPQAILHPLRRPANVRGCFRPAKLRGKLIIEDLKGLTVILVDDLTASGSTLEEAARVLKEELGVRKVIAAVLAVSENFEVMRRVIEGA